MLKHPDLFQNGYHLARFKLPPEIKKRVEQQDWDAVDAAFIHLTAPGSELFQFLLEYHSFETIEHILSIRDAKNAWEEDGIWHDDGSRLFSFSLSITLDAQSVQGGDLGIKKKEQESFLRIPTPQYGDIILFLTGVYGFEHKIHQVTSGTRIVIAGWCT